MATVPHADHLQLEAGFGLSSERGRFKVLETLSEAVGEICRLLVPKQGQIRDIGPGLSRKATVVQQYLWGRALRGADGPSGSRSPGLNTRGTG